MSLRDRDPLEDAPVSTTAYDAPLGVPEPSANSRAIRNPSFPPPHPYGVWVGQSAAHYLVPRVLALWQRSGVWGMTGQTW